MSTPTLTASDQIAYARGVLCAVKDMDWPEDRDSKRPLAHAFIALGDAIDLHDCLANGLIHWESCYPELRDVTDEPEQAALDRAAGDAADAAELLMGAAVTCCGDVAAQVAGQTGGEQ